MLLISGGRRNCGRSRRKRRWRRRSFINGFFPLNIAFVCFDNRLIYPSVNFDMEKEDPNGGEGDGSVWGPRIGRTTLIE